MRASVKFVAALWGFVLWPWLALCVAAETPQMRMDFAQQTRFVSAHGRRAWAAGYANGGLEIWAGALQIANDVRVEFRRPGDVTTIPGEQTVSSVAVDPSHFSRTYVGPDFSVEEQVWVPLDKPLVLMRYQVRSVRPVQVIVKFRPSLNLMWPAAVGGQELRWDEANSAYMMTEPSRRFAATLLAPGATAHDEPLNTTRSLPQTDEVAVVIDAKSPQVLFVRLKTSKDDTTGLDVSEAQQLLQSEQWRQEATKHYEQVLASQVHIETPDEDVNRALAWAEVALDEAWICGDQLGCAFAAGFGPSRRNRRPQYAWFFAGDGMFAMHAALAAGDIQRAREELRFIAKYQDAASGMIWHELSQSAAYIDWRGRYPYMFVHADATYPYVSAIADFVRSTDDREFLREMWPSVQKAYSYGRSLIGADGLPEIPAGKLGMDEQNALRDELGLSADWIVACDDYAHLSQLMGDARAAQEAQTFAEKARAAFAKQYWDPQRNFAIQGHRRSGEPMEGRGLGPAAAVERGLFSDAASREVLAQTASWRFQSDWGTRSVAEGDPGYDPAGYAHGSVWAFATASLAQTFWARHRPDEAWQIWRTLVPWFTLDSPGHMHEVLAGDTYHPQTESVPEQTWSSSLFLTSVVRGMMGIDVDAEHKMLTLAPHTPAAWDRVEVRNVKIGSSTISFSLRRDLEQTILRIENQGAPVHLRFQPQLPTGSKSVRATSGGRPVRMKLNTYDEDEHAAIEMDLGHGDTEVILEYRDGVEVVVPARVPRLGDPSVALKIVSVTLAGNKLRMVVDAIGAERNVFAIRTTRRIASAVGAKVDRAGANEYSVVLDGASSDTTYKERQIVITLNE